MHLTNWARTLTKYDPMRPRGNRSEFFIYATPEWMRAFSRDLLAAAETHDLIHYEEIGFRIVPCKTGDEVDRALLAKEREIWKDLGHPGEPQTLP